MWVAPVPHTERRALPIHRESVTLSGMSQTLSSAPDEAIDVRTPLALRTAFRFPLQSAGSRRDIIIGGIWLLVPVIGWLMNMGHRVRVVHRMHQHRDPWPAWERPGELLWHGMVTFAGDGLVRVARRHDRRGWDLSRVCRPDRPRHAAVGIGGGRDPRIHVPLLPRVRSARDLRPVSGPSPCSAGWGGLLEGLEHRRARDGAVVSSACWRGGSALRSPACGFGRSRPSASRRCSPSGSLWMRSSDTDAAFPDRRTMPAALSAFLSTVSEAFGGP